MSDDEMHSDEGEESEEEETREEQVAEEPADEVEDEPTREPEIREEHTEERRAPAIKMPQDTGPSEAELALQKLKKSQMQVDQETAELLELSQQEREREEEEIQQLKEKRRRKQQITSTDALDEFAAEILEQSRQRREALEEEIEEMRQRNERRKKERAEEEKLLAARRAEEDARLKAETEERKQKKVEEQAQRKAAYAAKMAEFEKWKEPQARNFVITKKEGGGAEPAAEEEEKGEKKSKEQLEAEKQAILKQRIHPLEISGFDAGKLSEKARELHAYIYRLESERYDLEKRFKEQQFDMMELAEKARSMNKVGKGGFKRVQLSEDQSDEIQNKYAGTSAKIEMYSKYERQKDKRSYVEKRTLFTGPVYGFPAKRITPQRIISWDEDGLPIYEGGSGGGAPAPPPEPQEEVAAEEE